MKHKMESKKKRTIDRLKKLIGFEEERLTKSPTNTSIQRSIDNLKEQIKALK